MKADGTLRKEQERAAQAEKGKHAEVSVLVLRDRQIERQVECQTVTS